MTKKNSKDELEGTLKKTFGVDIMEQIGSTRIPGTAPKTAPYGYTSASEIRERVMAIVQRPAKNFSQKQLADAGIDLDDTLMATQAKQKRLSEEERLQIAEQWIERLILNTQKRHRLMTDIQLADWRILRKLVPGDRARYIGPDRNEITQAQLIVPRLHGQTGIITSVLESRDSKLITFHPDKAVEPIDAPGVDKQLVDLQVREHTPGWLHLERIP